MVLLVAALAATTVRTAEAATTATWDRLAQCESGGDWASNTGNGHYGGLQFGQDTWDKYGGGRYAARADLAGRPEQIMVGETLLDDASWKPWPVCSHRLHLTAADALGTPEVAPPTGAPSPQAPTTTPAAPPTLAPMAPPTTPPSATSTPPASPTAPAGPPSDPPSEPSGPAAQAAKAPAQADNHVAATEPDLGRTGGSIPPDSEPARMAPDSTRRPHHHLHLPPPTDGDGPQSANRAPNRDPS